MTEQYQLNNTAEVRTFLKGAEYFGHGAIGANEFFPEVTALDAPDRVLHESISTLVKKPDEEDYKLRARVQREYAHEDDNSDTVTGSSLMITQGARNIVFLATGTLTSYQKIPEAMEDPDVADLVTELFEAYRSFGQRNRK